MRRWVAVVASFRTSLRDFVANYPGKATNSDDVQQFVRRLRLRAPDRPGRPHQHVRDVQSRGWHFFAGGTYTLKLKAIVARGDVGVVTLSFPARGDPQDALQRGRPHRRRVGTDGESADTSYVDC
jgi:hypothetical protein